MINVIQGSQHWKDHNKKGMNATIVKCFIVNLLVKQLMSDFVMRVKQAGLLFS